MQTALLAAVLGLLGSACTRESISPSVQEEDGSTITSIRFTGIETTTKTVLSTGIESMVSGIKLAVYDETGALEATAYVESDWSSGISLSLNGAVAHKVYALVNMGDVDVPYYEDEVADFTYYIEDYETMNAVGLPMAGDTSVKAGEVSGIISLKRLMARLDLSLSGEEVKYNSIKSVTLYNWNRKLSPFAEGGSKAEDVSTDIGQEEEGMFDETPDWQDAVFSLYVPENMQGDLLEVNEDPSLKSPTGLSIYGYGGMEDLCTYVEVTVNADPEGYGYGISGELSYRFFLGSDTTSNFDVERNTVYALSLILSWDGQFLEDDWIVDRTLFEDTRELTIEAPYTASHTDGADYSVGDYGEIWESWESAVFVNFSDGTNDLTEEGFSKTNGWQISENSLANLNALGIEPELTVATAVYDTVSFMLRYLREDEEMPSTCVDIGETARHCLLLYMESYDKSVDQVSLTLETTDGTMSSSVTLSLFPYIDLEAILDGDEEGDLHYIAQRNLLTVEGLPSWIYSYSVNVYPAEKEIISLEQYEDDSYLVDFLGKGSGFVIMDYDYVSEDLGMVNVVQTIKRVDVRAPIIRFSTDTLYITSLSPSLTAGYYDDNGEELTLTVAGTLSSGSSGDYEYSRNFYSSTYEDLLALDAELTDLIDEDNFSYTALAMSSGVLNIAISLSLRKIYESDILGYVRAYAPSEDVEEVSVPMMYSTFASLASTTDRIYR